MDMVFQTKTRIGLDASSKMKGQLSLNDVMYQGPLLLPNLCGILIRSRIGFKVMIADVEKAFHMIHLQEQERDSVRFLWLKDIRQPATQDNIRILRFCRLPFGINASPFLLALSIKYGLDQEDTLDDALHKQLRDNLYVDNILITDISTQSLLEKYHACKQIFNNISMNLRQFLTNDEIYNNSIAPKDLANNTTTKILGIPWNCVNDIFSIPCNLEYQPNSTKRKILRSIHATFDPLGLLIPLLLPAKTFLQDLWKAKLDWDEPLPPKLDREWQSICENATGYIVSVPRAITSFPAQSRYELHTFVDASAKSFAAAVYLREINTQGHVSSSLLMARQRLAPIKEKTQTMTIPRLELLALLIGIRLTHFVIKESQLTIGKIYIYSDSQVALHWVKSNSSNGTFVDNRCKEIKATLSTWSENGKECHLRYVPSENNPADCATRGLRKDQMKDHIWWSGPRFLQTEHTDWPDFPEFSWTNDEDLKTAHTPSHILLTTKCENTIFTRNFSTLTKFRRIASKVLKFLKVRIYNRISKEKQNKLEKAIPELGIIPIEKPLAIHQAIHLRIAENIIIKIMQKSFTKEEFKRWDNLSLYTDNNGIIRCRGRVNARYLAKDTTEPILLPANHQYTGLFIKEAHARCGHQGVNGTLGNLRLKYWIPKGRQTVKKCLRTCFICKKWNAKPYFYPESPQLPQSRTEPSRPFSHIGVDFAGPFRVLDRDKKEEERWIFLSTCMVTRAVHLEIARTLSGPELVNILRRFIARRGKPQLILSDNATNFKFAKEIIQTLDPQEFSSEIQTFLANEFISWKFITPLSPWKGGFYERMIGVMKSTIRRVARRMLQEDEFSTMVIECEAMINSRPLTYAGSSVEDSLILRPIDFLIPHANLDFAFKNETDDDQNYLPKLSTRDAAVQHFNRHLHYLQQVWNFWTENYLLELRNFHQKRIRQKTFTRSQPAVGEVVLVMNEDTNHGKWPLGLVTKLINDADGIVRSVELKTSKNKMIRAINMLIPLEIEENNKSDENQKQRKQGNDTGSAAEEQGMQTIPNEKINQHEITTPAPEQSTEHYDPACQDSPRKI